MAFVEEKTLEYAAEPTSEDDEDHGDAPSNQLVEVVVLPNATLTGESLATIRFRQHYDATVLALRRSGHPQNRTLSTLGLRGGNTLLIQASREAIRHLSTNRNFVLTRELEAPECRSGKTPGALGIVAAVIVLATVGLAVGWRY